MEILLKAVQTKSQTRTDELWRWTATELAHAIQTGVISSREAVQSSLNRIEEVNPTLNALAKVLTEEALAAADDADKALAQGNILGPLHGVPVSTKVNVDQAGQETTHGVVDFKDNIATNDSPIVANLRNSGSIIVGRSNAPAFAYRWVTSNDLHGRTLNPWDLTRTPGGSSGGAASSVAAGMTPIAHGNDIGGSVRYPAYACGVMGLRPTPGRFPGGGIGEYSPSFQFMAVEGPLARTVSDLRLSFAAMSQFQPSQTLYAPVPLIGKPLQTPIRVGLLRHVGIAKPSTAVNQALDQAAENLRKAGYIVEEVNLPLFKEAFELWYLLCMMDFKEIMPAVEQSGDKGIKKAVKYFFEVTEEFWGKDPSLSDYIKGYTRRGILIHQLQEFLQSHPLLLLPTSTEQTFKQDADIESSESMRKIISSQWSMMSLSVLGFPSVSVPTSVVDGLPVGIQILGRQFREDTLFDAAEVIEANSTVKTPIDPQQTIIMS